MDDVACRMEAGPLDGDDGIESFVEDADRDADERRAQARATGGADRQHRSLVPDRERWRHHARHPRAGDERREHEIDLSQHAVEVEVEAREEVAGAEAQAGRQDADAAGSVDGHEIRGVRTGEGRVVEGVEERQHPLRLCETPQRGHPAEQLRDTREPSTGVEVYTYTS